MKKILIGILMVLLVFLAYFAIFKGITLGGFQLLSVEQIQDENKKLTAGIAETETLIYSTYRNKTDELESSVSTLLATRDEYLDLAQISTDGELAAANKEETYKIEYLWTRIGSHATSEGVDLKLDILAGETGEADVKNLSFSVTGNYIAVINFVISIEDDSQLGFRIENFKILPGSSTNGRQATFIVRNVRIKQETVSDPIVNSNQTTTDNTTVGTGTDPMATDTNTSDTNTADTNTTDTNQANTNTSDINPEELLKQ